MPIRHILSCPASPSMNNMQADLIEQCWHQPKLESRETGQLTRLTQTLATAPRTNTAGPVFIPNAEPKQIVLQRLLLSLRSIASTCGWRALHHWHISM